MKAPIRLVTLFSSVLIATAIGCRSVPPAPPPPFHGPAVSTGFRYFAGTPLSGTARAAPALDTGDLYPVSISALALERLPSDSLDAQPLGTRARFFASADEGRAVRALARRTAGIRLAFPADAASLCSRIESGEFGRAVTISHSQGALPPGVTAVYELAGKPPSLERLEIHVHRGGGHPGEGPAIAQAAADIQVALVAEGTTALSGEILQGPQEAPPGGETGSGPGERATPKGSLAERELVLLDPFPAGEESSLLLLAPSPFEGPAGHALALVLGLGPSGRRDLETLEKEDPDLARCMDELRRTGESPVTPPAKAIEPSVPGLAQALQVLASPPTQRRGLLLLAQDTGAHLAEDVALTGDHSAVNDLAGLVLKKAGGAEVDRAQLGWILESAALELLLGLLSDDKLPDELGGVLVRHAGQVGRQIASLEDALKASQGVEDFRARLVDENVVALEDTSPAARVRAYDWLEAQGRAPEGFDPLAPAEERRAALEKAFDSRTEQDTGGEKP